MNSPFLCRLLALTIFGMAGASAAEPPIIAKARAWLGSEEALNAVRSVHYDATATAEAVTDPATRQVVQMDIVFQKPRQECMTTVGATLLQRQALDGYDAWLLRQPLSPGDPPRFNPHKPQALTILGAEQSERLQAEAQENLYFYSGVEAGGGTVEDLGAVSVGGVACEKVVFHYTGQVSYTHYFESSSGRLVLTETYAGAKIREEGEVRVDGIRFPREIILEQEMNGKAQKTVVRLNRIRLNERFPAERFATPPPPLPLDRPVASGPSGPTAAGAAAASDGSPAPTAAPAPGAGP